MGAGVLGGIGVGLGLLAAGSAVAALGGRQNAQQLVRDGMNKFRQVCSTWQNALLLWHQGGKMCRRVLEMCKTKDFAKRLAGGRMHVATLATTCTLQEPHIARACSPLLSHLSNNRREHRLAPHVWLLSCLLLSSATGTLLVPAKLVWRTLNGL